MVGFRWVGISFDLASCKDLPLLLYCAAPSILQVVRSVYNLKIELIGMFSSYFSATWTFPGSLLDGGLALPDQKGSEETEIVWQKLFGTHILVVS